MKQHPFLNLKKLHDIHGGEIRAAMDRVIEHGQFINGPEVGEFNCAWAGYCGVPSAVGCANGTNALHAILYILGIGPGDEVILPSHTFVATAESVRLTGATPVFAEIDGATMLVDVKSVESLVNARTQAIIPVHLYGATPDMDGLSAVAQRHGLPVIEDAAQAHGATHRGKKAGGLGLAASWSFFPGKNLGAFGDAGGITTTDEELGRRLRLFINHGREAKFENEVMGTNYRLDTLQAAILLAKLPHLDEWIGGRRRIARIYDRILSAEPFASIPVGIQKIPADVESAYHLYVIRVPERDRVRDELKKAGVATGIHYPIPCHLQPSMADVPGNRGSLPITESVCESIISLPMCPTMTEGDAEAICGILAEVLTG